MAKIREQVGEYLDYCEKVRGMSAATLVCKRNVLERFVRVTGVGDVRRLTNEVFNEWVFDLTERGVAPRSINTYNAVVLAMVRYWRGVGMAVPLQMGLVGKMREGAVRRRFFTADEVERAIEHADFETGLMIRIMFETGMRIAELTHLKVSDFKGRRIQFIGKGRKPREVYVREETLREVMKLVRGCGCGCGDGCGCRCVCGRGCGCGNGGCGVVRSGRGASVYLFGGKSLDGTPPTVATVRKRLRRPFVAAGLTDFYPHSLRHSFATRLQMKGASVEEIKEMMGHESVATTERYLHGFEGRLEELFDKYG